MPKNKGKGGKNRKKGKNDIVTNKRELLFAEDEQIYGLVTKKLGNCNLEVECSDDIKRIGHIRGSMRKKVWIDLQHTVLLSLRNFQDNIADIIHVYDSDEVRMLKTYEELPDKWGNNNIRFDDSQDDNNVPPDDEIFFDIDEI